MYNKRWLTPEDFELEFKVLLSTQAKKRSNKKLPYSKWGGLVFYDRIKIDAMLEDHDIAM